MNITLKMFILSSYKIGISFLLFRTKQNKKEMSEEKKRKEKKCHNVISIAFKQVFSPISILATCDFLSHVAYCV